jgi:hypothetical protein
VAQAVARARVAGFSPEECGELVARVGVAGPDAEIGEQGLGLAGGQAHGAARVEPGLEPAEQRQAEGHDDRSSRQVRRL